MSRGTAEAIIRQALCETKRVTFAFQGGEPTLWGLENFRFFVETVNRLGMGGAEVCYALQTNGLLISEEWAAFFKEHDFLIGLSLDGYKELHDTNRVDAAGQGSYNRALKAAAVLRKAGVAFNILAVVTSQAARHTEKLYRFYQSQNFKYLQFIPCIDDFGSMETSLTAAEYGTFLKTLFDLWYRGCIKGQGVSIRYFDNLLDVIMGRPPELCSMSGTCPVNFTIEADGGVYPCDFYVLDQWLLGNVQSDSFASMLSTDAAGRFTGESKPLPEECARCRWLMLCRGGCKRDRKPILGGLPSQPRFCQAYKDFFAYSYERFAKLRAHLAR